MRADGAPGRNLDEYSAWRREACDENLRLLRIYGTWLVGQYAGMSEALSLQAVESALRIERVPPSERREVAERLMYLHLLWMQHRPRSK